MHQFTLTHQNVHRIIAVSVLMAMKINDNMVVSNKAFAYSAGLSLPELNQLELEFIIAIEFEFFVSREEYQECLQKMHEIYGHNQTFNELIAIQSKVGAVFEYFTSLWTETWQVKQFHFKYFIERLSIDDRTLRQVNWSNLFAE